LIVTAFHQMRTPGGSYAEYAVAWNHTTIHIPSHITFEQASTLPLAVLTAAVGLYETRNLGLNNPWDPAIKETPLVVYGGASAVGAYAIQLARKSNIHPIITVAGRGIPFVEGIIDRSKGDTIVDYRDGDEAVVEGIKKALGGKKLFYAYDAISEKGSYINISKVIEKGGRIALVLQGKDIPSDIYYNSVSVGDVHKEEYKDFGRVHFLNVKQGLEDGWLKPHPHVVVEGGLAGIEKALTDLKEGKASATKYVFRIKDTPGLKSSL
jgi:NADPH2:quinone reductase